MRREKNGKWEKRTRKESTKLNKKEMKKNKSMNETLTSTILLIIGRAVSSKSNLAFWFPTKFSAWPKIPNPVTSVQAWLEYLCINMAPCLFNLAIDSWAEKNASLASSALITSKNSYKEKLKIKA